MAELQNSGVKVEARTLTHSKCFNADYDERMFVFAKGNKVYKTVFTLKLSNPAIKKLQYILEVELEDFIDRYFINDSRLLNKVHTPSFHIEIKTCPWWAPEEFKSLTYNGKPLNFVETEYIFYVTLCPQIKNLLGMSEKYEDNNQLFAPTEEEFSWDDINNGNSTSGRTSMQEETECDDNSDWTHLTESDDDNKSEQSGYFETDDVFKHLEDEDINVDVTDTPEDKTDPPPRIFLVTKVDENKESVSPKSSQSDISVNAKVPAGMKSQYFFSPLATSKQNIEVESFEFVDNAERLLCGNYPDTKEDFVDNDLNRRSELFTSTAIPSVIDFSQSKESLINTESILVGSTTGQSDDKKRSFGWGLISKLFGK